MWVDSKGVGDNPGPRQSRGNYKKVMPQERSEIVERLQMATALEGNILVTDCKKRRWKDQKQKFKKEKITLGPAGVVSEAASGKASQGR